MVQIPSCSALKNILCPSPPATLACAARSAWLAWQHFSKPKDCEMLNQTVFVFFRLDVFSMMCSQYKWKNPRCWNVSKTWNEMKYPIRKKQLWKPSGCCFQVVFWGAAASKLFFEVLQCYNHNESSGSASWASTNQANFVCYIFTWSKLHPIKSRPFYLLELLSHAMKKTLGE